MERTRLRRTLAAVGRRRLAAFAALQAAILAVLGLPFVLTYGPVLLAGGQRSWATVLTFIAPLQSGLDFGGGNLLWGWLTRALGSGRTQAYYHPERSLAPTPLVTVLWAASAAWLWRRRRAGPLAPEQAVLIAAGIATVAIVPLLARVGTVSLWWPVWAVLPGARAIRTPTRFQLVLALPVWLMIAHGGAQLRSWLAARRSRRAADALVAAAAALLLLEQVNLSPVALIDRDAENARLARIAAPPPGCRAFYVLSREPRGEALQTDAMMAAMRSGLPTLNGTSGDFPPGWLPLADAAGPGYASAVAAWADAHGIAATLCALALPAGDWLPPRPGAAAP
jgi:hypothetical protein